LKAFNKQTHCVTLVEGAFHKPLAMKPLFIFICLFAFVFACTQQESKHASINYPATELHGDTAALFAYGTISTDSFDHSAPTFSPDGKTVLWGSISLPSWKASIWEMNFAEGAWSTPHFPSFADSVANDVYPSFSPDGKVLYFSSSRNLPSGRTPEKGNLLWRVSKTASGWGVPEPLDSTISKEGDYASSAALNGNLYFTHGPFQNPDWNIMIFDKANNLRSKLPVPVNTTVYEDGPFIAPDETYIIFESDRPGGVNGSIDLYIAFKLATGSWSEPINMGSKINTSVSERFARVSPDGKFLFFGSNRRLVNGQQNFDTYWINATIIDELRAKVAL
jgi:Tol biopolymer transport system component